MDNPLDPEALNAITLQKQAVMELYSRAVKVTGYKWVNNVLAIEIEPTELYQDGESIHQCRLVFKKD